MKSLTCFAATIGAAALLAGCGGSQLPIGAPGAMPQTSAFATHADNGKSWMLTEAKSENLIYVSDTSSVLAFNDHGKQVGAIEYVLQPGVCSDAQGDVWVTNEGEAIEFPHGGGVPIGEVYAPSSYEFESCAVDPATGNLAATLYQENGHGAVAVYEGTSGNPQTYTDSDMSYYTYCSFDGSGDLFVNGGYERKVFLAELPRGGSSLSTVRLDKRLGGVGGLQWDGTYVVLGDSHSNVVYQVDVSNGQGTVESSTRFLGWHLHKAVDFWIYNAMIGFVYSDRYFGLWKYPQGGRATHRFLFQSRTTGGTAFSIAPAVAMGRD
jgi:hypothetical protein